MNKLIFLLVAFISLTITSVISAFLGFSFYLLHWGFWPGFILAFALQTVIYGLYSKIKDKKTSAEIQKLELARNNKQIIPLSCSFCKKESLVPIKLDIENRFTCPHCNENNLVIIQYTVAQVSIPKMARIDIDIPKEVNLPDNINVDKVVKDFLVDNSKKEKIKKERKEE